MKGKVDISGHVGDDAGAKAPAPQTVELSVIRKVETNKHVKEEDIEMEFPDTKKV